VFANFWQLGVWHEASGQVGQKKKRIAAFLGSFLTSFSKHFIV